jgi:hypothetical protein
MLHLVQREKRTDLMSIKIVQSDLSRKVVTLLTCGAILAGAGIQVGLVSLTTDSILHAETEERNRNTSSMKSLREDAIKRLEEDKKFLSIEPKLVPLVIDSDSDALPTYVEEFEQTHSLILRGMYPLIPAYSEYLDALEAADASSAANSEAMRRLFQRDGFKYTCKMVSDLNAGLDISQKDKEGYPGEYNGLFVGEPANFETLLKGCGDENLDYLDTMQAEYKVSEKESAQMWAEMEALNAEVETLQEQGIDPTLEEPVEDGTEEA